MDCSNSTVCHETLKTGPNRKQKHPGRPSIHNKKTWARAIINEFVNNNKYIFKNYKQKIYQPSTIMFNYENYEKQRRN